MELFKSSGGRLFRIALIFVGVCILALGVMSYFTARAMRDMKEIATTKNEEGEFVEVPVQFYSQLIDNMKFGTVLSALSGVLIAVAARYGLRETAKSFSEGQVAKAQVQQSQQEAK